MNLEVIINQVKGMSNSEDVKAYLKELVNNHIITEVEETNILSQINITTQTNTSTVENTNIIKRYTTEELNNIILNLLYEEIATSTKMHFTNKYVEQNMLRPRFRHNQRQIRVKDIQNRIKHHIELREAETTEHGKSVYTESLELLNDVLKLESDFTPKNQKAYFKKYNDIFTSHSFTEFPLNKKINGLYDDFNAVVVYYDNLTTEEIISKLESKSLSLEEKKQLVKDNIEVTHIILGASDTVRADIGTFGNFDKQYSDIENGNATTLPIKFSDFSKITLADCEQIKNNDLAQIVQERIDMDKEDLQLLSEMTIKGETYKVFKSPNTDKEYIRYVCPSTQRVYYNVLNHEFLKNDEYGYYKKGDVDSYIKAWYSITNLGIELTEEEIARPSISC